MNTARSVLFPLSLLAFVLFPSVTHTRKDIPSSEEIRRMIVKVNDYWQSRHPEPGNAFWDQAAYHTGNMAAWQVTGIKRYLDYSEAWAEKNHWKGATSDDRAKWKYSYGESDEYVLFGDWQVCFQTYIDLYNCRRQGDPGYAGNPGDTGNPGDSVKIARALEVMEYQMSTGRSDYWWWADGLYMVMPVMTKLYRLTGDSLYLEKLHEYFSYTLSIMYDEETGLFFRDARYVYPRHKTLSGKKDFWARGDGWVFAGLAKVIPDLPDDYAHKDYFLQIFRKMADALVDSQQAEGYWSRSLLDPGQAPGPESSGTAFITFGLLKGINSGLLSEEEYLPTALRAWEFLVLKAVDENGRVGYVQPIGERAIPGQVVDERSTSNFGVGAFLLAASEMYIYTGK